MCLASLAAGSSAPSSAADYPNCPVRWLIGSAAGCPVDTVASIMSQALSEHFGQHSWETEPVPAETSQPQPGSLRPPTATRCCSGRQQRDLGLALQESAVRLHPRHRARRGLDGGPEPAGSLDALPVKTVQELIDYCKANPGKSPLPCPATVPRCICRRSCSRR